MKVDTNVDVKAEQARRDQARAERFKYLTDAQQPLLTALAEVGVKVSSVWDLVNSTNWYAAAIPTLLAHLNRDYPDEIRAGIARALAIPQARVGWDVVASAFKIEPNSTATKEGLAAALGEIAGEEQLDSLIEFLCDRTQGASRVLLLPALKRSRSQKAKAAIETLRGDSQLAKEIASWRKKIPLKHSKSRR